jgi:hypothetical protein
LHFSLPSKVSPIDLGESPSDPASTLANWRIGRQGTAMGLYQGTTSIVPDKVRYTRGFSPWQGGPKPGWPQAIKGVRAGALRRFTMSTNKLYYLPAFRFFAVLTLAPITHLSLLNAQTLDRLQKGPAGMANHLKMPAATAPSVSTAGAVNYDFVTVDVPGFPTSVYGINGEGLLTGFYGHISNLHAFFIRDNVLQQIDYPGSGFTAFGDSTNGGVVIGNYGDSFFAAQHAVLYDTNRGAWTHLPDVPNYPQNFGNGINNRNQAAGGACELPPALPCEGWTSDGKKYSFFQAPQADPSMGGTYANGINDSNEVVGYFVDSGGVTHGFLKDEDDFTTLDPPGSTFTFASDVNAREETVGYYIDGNGKTHGFLEKHGKYTTIDYPNSVGSFIYGNNSRGDIAGGYYDLTGAVHGFVGYRRTSATE